MQVEGWNKQYENNNVRANANNGGCHANNGRCEQALRTEGLQQHLVLKLNDEFIRFGEKKVTGLWKDQALIRTKTLRIDA